MCMRGLKEACVAEVTNEVEDGHPCGVFHCLECGLTYRWGQKGSSITNLHGPVSVGIWTVTCLQGQLLEGVCVCVCVCIHVCPDRGGT